MASIKFVLNERRLAFEGALRKLEEERVELEAGMREEEEHRTQTETSSTPDELAQVETSSQGQPKPKRRSKKIKLISAPTPEPLLLA